MPEGCGHKAPTSCCNNVVANCNLTSIIDPYARPHPLIVGHDDCAGGTPSVQIQPKLANARPKCNVLCHRHVLEQRIALEDKAYLPLLNRDLCCILICKSSNIAT